MIPQRDPQRPNAISLVMLDGKRNPKSLSALFGHNNQNSALLTLSLDTIHCLRINPLHSVLESSPHSTTASNLYQITGWSNAKPNSIPPNSHEATPHIPTASGNRRGPTECIQITATHKHSIWRRPQQQRRHLRMGPCHQHRNSAPVFCPCWRIQRHFLINTKRALWMCLRLVPDINRTSPTVEKRHRCKFRWIVDS